MRARRRARTRKAASRSCGTPCGSTPSSTTSRSLRSRRRMVVSTNRSCASSTGSAWSWSAYSRTRSASQRSSGDGQAVKPWPSLVPTRERPGLGRADICATDRSPLHRCRADLWPDVSVSGLIFLLAQPLGEAARRGPPPCARASRLVSTMSEHAGHPRIGRDDDEVAAVTEDGPRAQHCDALNCGRSRYAALGPHRTSIARGRGCKQPARRCAGCP